MYQFQITFIPVCFKSAGVYIQSAIFRPKITPEYNVSTSWDKVLQIVSLEDSLCEISFHSKCTLILNSTWIFLSADSQLKKKKSKFKIVFMD